MTGKKRAAIEAFARHLAATSNAKNVAREAVQSLGEKRVAVRVAKIVRKSGNRPRLRFDKVVVELLERLQTALSQSVPDGKTVLVTVTAPIRQSGKTARTLEERIMPLLVGRAPPTEFADTIEGNAVRVRVAKIAQAPKVIGFVHNPGLDTRAFLDVVQSLLVAVGAPKKSSGARWLVLLDAQPDWPAATWRQILSGLPTQFENILIVREDGRVEFLTDR